MLVFEDLHWADDALVAFVEHLVDWSSGVPLLVLCSARPELYERHPGWGGGKRNSNTISLSPLGADETARLLAALLQKAVLPAETQRTLLERAGGNPLYAEEFVRMLSDRGVLTEQGQLINEDIPVPDNVQALIAARLDTLAPDRKALLHDGAVVGVLTRSRGGTPLPGRGQARAVEDAEEIRFADVEALALERGVDVAQGGPLAAELAGPVADRVTFRGRLTTRPDGCEEMRMRTLHRHETTPRADTGPEGGHIGAVVGSRVEPGGVADGAPLARG